MESNIKEVHEGCEIPIVNESHIQEIPVVFFDDYRELLYQEEHIQPDSFDSYCAENFEIHPELGKTTFSPTGEPYKTYAVGIYLTQEMMDDFPNIRQKAEVFLWKEVWKFFETAKQSFKKIYWRIKPVILTIEPNRYNYIGEFLYIRMRLLMK